MALTRYLNLDWKMHFPAIYSMQNFDTFWLSGPPMVFIRAKLSIVKFYMNFSRYNFKKLIRTLQSILKLSCRPLALVSYKTFVKNKERSGTCLSISFSAWFWKKILLLLYSVTWPNLISLLPLPLERLVNMCIAIVYYLLWRHIFSN